MKKKVYSCLMVVGVILFMSDKTCNLFGGETVKHAEKLNTSTSLKEVFVNDLWITYSVKTTTCVGSGRIVCQEGTVMQMVDVRDTSPQTPIV